MLTAALQLFWHPPQMLGARTFWTLGGEQLVDPNTPHSRAKIGLPDSSQVALLRLPWALMPLLAHATPRGIYTAATLRGMTPRGASAAYMGLWR